MAKIAERPLFESAWGRAMYDTWTAIHTARFWATEIVALTAAGSFAGWESTVQHWSPVETAVFSTLVVIGMAFAVVVLIYGGSWVLAWPRQRNEARKHIEQLQSGYLEIEAHASTYGVGKIDRSETGLDVRGSIVGVLLAVTNTSDSSPVSIRKVNVVCLEGATPRLFPKKIDGYHPADSDYIDEDRLLKGPPLNETAYLRPHETTRGVVNFTARTLDKNIAWYLFVEDSYGNDYQCA